MNIKPDSSTKHKNCLLIFTLLGICLFTACGEQPVATATNEYDANHMFDVLYSNGFQAKKNRIPGETELWQISVDEGWFGSNEASVAIQVLRDYNLPRPPESQKKETSGLGMASEREEKERQRREQELRIEKQLYNLPDVISVVVNIAEPINDILSQEKIPPTASVSITLKDNQPKFTIEDVRGMVSGAVPNLKPANVTVTLSQQALREFPREKLDAQRQRNATYVIGGIVILLLGASLGAVWYITKRRKKKESAEPKQLTEEQETDEIQGFERSALTDNNEE